MSISLHKMGLWVFWCVLLIGLLSRQALGALEGKSGAAMRVFSPYGYSGIGKGVLPINPYDGSRGGTKLWLEGRRLIQEQKENQIQRACDGKKKNASSYKFKRRGFAKNYARLIMLLSVTSFRKYCSSKRYPAPVPPVPPVHMAQPYNIQPYLQQAQGKVIVRHKVQPMRNPEKKKGDNDTSGHYLLPVTVIKSPIMNRMKKRGWSIADRFVFGRTVLLSDPDTVQSDLDDLLNIEVRLPEVSQPLLPFYWFGEAVYAHNKNSQQDCNDAMEHLRLLATGKSDIVADAPDPAPLAKGFLDWLTVIHDDTVQGVASLHDVLEPIISSFEESKLHPERMMLMQALGEVLVHSDRRAFQLLKASKEIEGIELYFPVDDKPEQGRFKRSDRRVRKNKMDIDYLDRQMMVMLDKRSDRRVRKNKMDIDYLVREMLEIMRLEDVNSDEGDISDSTQDLTSLEDAEAKWNREAEDNRVDEARRRKEDAELEQDVNLGMDDEELSHGGGLEDEQGEESASDESEDETVVIPEEYLYSGGVKNGKVRYKRQLLLRN